MYVRASFCVSNVGMIVSSSGEALGLSAGVGISVCAHVVADSAKIDNAIERPPTANQIDFIRKICVNFPNNTQTVIPSEVEGSRDTALRSFHGIPRLRFASLGMTATFGNIAPKSMALQKSVHLFG